MYTKMYFTCVTPVKLGAQIEADMRGANGQNEMAEDLRVAGTTIPSLVGSHFQLVATDVHAAPPA